MMQLTNQPWEPPLPVKKSVSTGTNLTGGGGSYAVPWKRGIQQKVSKSFMHQAHPRIVFISSRIPAADVSVLCMVWVQ